MKHLILTFLLISALCIFLNSRPASAQYESRPVAPKQCVSLPLVGSSCIQINATGCASMSVAANLGTATRMTRSLGMLELTQTLRARQQVLVASGKPEFPVTECFRTEDGIAQYCYEVGRFNQSSLRTGASSNSVTMSLKIKLIVGTQEYAFNFGTFTLQGCEMLSCGDEWNLCHGHGTCTSFGCSCTDSSYWGPQCSYQTSMEESLSCISTLGQKICPSASIDESCSQLNVEYNTTVKSFDIPLSMPYRAEISCQEDFLSSKCSSCTVLDHLQVKSSPSAPSSSLWGCVGVEIKCLDSPSISRNFGCSTLISRLPDACKRLTPPPPPKPEPAPPAPKPSTPSSQNLTPSSSDNTNGAPSQVSGGSTRWIVIFIFLAMLAFGCGVLYWYIQSRGGFSAVFKIPKKKKNKGETVSQVPYVRQTDDGPELEVAMEEHVQIELDSDHQNKDETDTVDVELR